MTYFKVLSKYLPVRTEYSAETITMACCRAVIWIRD